MVIFTKFHKDRTKIVDFLLIAKFWACLLFFHSPSSCGADATGWVVFGLSAIISVAYQFPQKRTLRVLSMRGISVISHNTIVIIIFFLKPRLAGPGEKR